MRTASVTKRLAAGLMAGLILLFMGVGFPTVTAKAASGYVYTCAITPCYQHPVTGNIEDAGGSSSYATGQGMVEGCVYSNGILEVTDSGEYYLTFRMSLMDYTSDHSFLVQQIYSDGSVSDWYTPALGQTGSGTDTNGTTADICVQVPSESCIVRVSMYVDPMGRDVIFYLYPSDYVAGNNTDMNATIVTTSSGSSGTGTTTSGSTSTGTTSGSTSTSGTTSSGSSVTSGTSSVTSSTDGTSSTSSTAPSLSSSISSGLTAASTDDDNSFLTDSDSTLDSSEGLSLSTEEDAAESTDGQTGGSSTQTILTWVISITAAILVVVGFIAFLVYYFRKNWRRWGGGMDDEEEYDD